MPHALAFSYTNLENITVARGRDISGPKEIKDHSYKPLEIVTSGNWRIFTMEYRLHTFMVKWDVFRQSRIIMGRFVKIQERLRMHFTFLESV